MALDLHALERAWSAAFAVVAGAMLEGAADAQPALAA